MPDASLARLPCRVYCAFAVDAAAGCARRARLAPARREGPALARWRLLRCTAVRRWRLTSCQRRVTRPLLPKKAGRQRQASRRRLPREPALLSRRAAEAAGRTARAFATATTAATTATAWALSWRTTGCWRCSRSGSATAAAWTSAATKAWCRSRWPSSFAPPPSSAWTSTARWCRARRPSCGGCSAPPPRLPRSWPPRRPARRCPKSARRWRPLPTRSRRRATGARLACAAPARLTPPAQASKLPRPGPAGGECGHRRLPLGQQVVRRPAPRAAAGTPSRRPPGCTSTGETRACCASSSAATRCSRPAACSSWSRSRGSRTGRRCASNTCVWVCRRKPLALG